MSGRLDWRAAPAPGPLRGEVVVPGDKSISHRAVMLAALAEGTSCIHGFLEAEDTRATARMFEQMGVAIDIPGAGQRIVHGVGLTGLCAPHGVLDCGNSGTGMRLVAGVLAGQSFDATLAGDRSLSLRPMRRITEPLTQMGACIQTAGDGKPPLVIHGRRKLHGIAYSPPVASAQVKSAITLAGLYAEGETSVTELRPTRDYTERMLAARGWPIVFEPGKVRLSGHHALRAIDTDVPADFSSAAFFVVAATLVPGSELVLRNIGTNPRRIGLLHVLRAMGADITEENPREIGGEPMADLTVRHARLQGIEVSTRYVTDMIDEFPALFVAAAGARGLTTITGAHELRVKESDRIAVMAAGLRGLGAHIEETADGARIEGGILNGGTVDACGDHRCAMAFAVAATTATDAVGVHDCANVATSFPGFLELSEALGLPISQASKDP